MRVSIAHRAQKYVRIRISDRRGAYKEQQPFHVLPTPAQHECRSDAPHAWIADLWQYCGTRIQVRSQKLRRSARVCCADMAGAWQHFWLHALQSNTMVPEYDLLAAKLTHDGHDVAAIVAALSKQHIETPSWGYANSGTRFKAFPHGPAPPAPRAKSSTTPPWSTR